MTLIVKNLCKTINNKKVVRDVSFEVNRGEIVGLLGPNGAGKSTSFYMVIGLTSMTAGNIFLDDMDISILPAYKRARLGISYLPQESSIFQNMTVEQNIMVALEINENDNNERQRILDTLLQEFNISHLKAVKGVALSGGERRRVEIARCIATKPAYILLDEPFAGIDPIAVADIKNLILQLKKHNIGILITDHNVKDALTIVERGYVIYNGVVLASGDTNTLLLNPQVQQCYLGHDFKL